MKREKKKTTIGSGKKRTNILTQTYSDSLPHWPHHHHRPQKDSLVLCAETKGQRHRRLLRGSDSDSNTVDVHRVHSRGVRNCGLVWGFLRHHCRVCQGNPRHWTVYRDGGGSDRAGSSKCGTASLIWKKTRVHPMMQCSDGRDILATVLEILPLCAGTEKKKRWDTQIH